MPNAPNPIGFTMPFAETQASPGFLAFTTSSLEATTFNLKSLVLTNWGERPQHYFLGCNLIEFLFAPIGDETQQRIVQRIETQVAQWLPYVLLNDVSVVIGEPEGQKLTVTINFGIKGRQDLSSVLVVVFPAGA